MKFIDRAFDFLFPSRCIFCRNVLKSGENQICGKCCDELPFTSGSNISRKGEFFDICVSPLYYSGNVRNAILRFKFKKKSGYAEFFSTLLSSCISETLSGKYDIISWVPTTKERRKQRGYDQAMLLSMATALKLDNVAVETLRKTSNSPPQSSLSGVERRHSNVLGTYEVSDPEIIRGKRILLIDDIITTGATLSECAKTLLESGAESVVCAALARSAYGTCDENSKSAPKTGQGAF